MSDTNEILEGSRTGLSFVEEVELGKIPTSGAKYNLKCGNESLDAMQNTEFESDISSTGGKKSVTRGLLDVSGGFTGQMESGAYDKFILSLVRRKALTTKSLTGVATGATGSADGKTCVITGSGMDVLQIGIGIKLSAFSNPALNDIFRVVSTSPTSLVIGLIRIDQDFTDIAETGETGNLYQAFVLNQGNQVTSFSVEKDGSAVNKEECFQVATGVQTNSMKLDGGTGGGVTVAFDFIGINDFYNNDGMLSPKNYIIDGAGTEGDSTITVKDGSTVPIAGDQFFIEDDSSNTKYTVVSISTLTITLDQVLGADIVDESKIFFNRKASSIGTGQKMENNLGFLVVDGESICTSNTNMTITPSLSPISCMGNENAVKLSAGDRMVTGALSAYFSSKVQPLLKKIRAFESFPISFFMSDSLGNNIAVYIPKAIADKEMLKKADAGALTQNIPFKSLEDSSDVNTIISILTA